MPLSFNKKSMGTGFYYLSSIDNDDLVCVLTVDKRCATTTTVRPL